MADSKPGGARVLPRLDAAWPTQPLSGSAVSRGILIFMVLGVLARAVRYFLRFPLWEDECFLVGNYIDAGYGDLLEPLQPHQAAPILYLWAQLTIVKLLGFTELSLRLFAFAASIASLFLFRRLAGRLLEGTSLLLAVAFFAVAYPCIRYSAEAKPYGVDLLVGVVLITLVVQWLQRPDRTRALWILAAIAPLAIGMSYPAAFLGGGISLTVAFVLLKTGERRGWLPWVAYNVLLCGSVLVLLVAAKSQTTAELEWMRAYWKDAFLPREAAAVLVWLLKIHTGGMFGYPAGNGPGGGAFGVSCFVIGVVVLFRRRRTVLALLVLAPLALHFVAGAIRRYPYGGHPKFTVYLAPVICIVCGLGAAALLAQIAKTQLRGTRFTRGLLTIFALIAVGSIVRDVARPYKTRSDNRARAFAQWFWFSAEHDGEVVDVKTDLGLSFSESEDTELTWYIMYLVNQRIYSPRHAAGEPPRLDLVSKDHPVRFVRYRAGSISYDEAAFDRWLTETKQRYRVVSHEQYSFPRYDKRERRLLVVDYLDVYKCVPKG